MCETSIPTEFTEVEQEFWETHRLRFGSTPGETVPSGTSTQLRGIFESLIPKIREYASSRRLGTSRYSSLLDDAEGVIFDLTCAMNKYREETPQTEPYDRLCHRLTIEYVINRPEAWRDVSPVDARDLDHATARYLKRPWMQSDRIDWILINAFIFDTLARWATSLTRTAPWSLRSDRFDRYFVTFWLSIPLVMLVAYLFEGDVAALGYGTIYGVAVRGISAIWAVLTLLWIVFCTAYVVYLSVSARQKLISYLWHGLPSGRRVNKARVIRLLRRLYTVSSHETINPSRLREQLVAAEEEGIMITPAVYALVDRAVQRDAAVLTYQI